MLSSETKPLPAPSKSSKSEKRSTVRKLTLYSALPPQAVLSQLDLIAEPSNKDILLKMWQRANAAYNGLANPFRSLASPDDVQPLEGVSKTKVDALVERTKLYPPYDSHTFSINNVRISKLVTPQLSVNPERAKNRADIKPGLSSEQLLDLAFKSGSKHAPVNRQTIGIAGNGGAVLFTSYDEDVRIHHPPQYRKLPVNEKDHDGPTLENVCFAVGGGLSVAAAYQIPVPGGTKLILSNGIHRVYSLAREGYEWCPLVVCDLTAAELPEPFVELPKDFLLNPTQNPPLATDFLNNDIVIPLEYYSLLRTVRLNWNFEQYATVLK
jgi:hypothetical protein